ncbi:FKBP12-associated protein, partial [Bonamia ostreae]
MESVDKMLLNDLIKQKLEDDDYDCSICLSKIGKRAKVWSCKKCWSILHLSCIQKWAKNSSKDAFWRCPSCNSNYPAKVDVYKCFCGKSTFPEFHPFLIPHSCGQICLREKPGCPHRCILLCHPGPCPPCSFSTETKCPCGKTDVVIDCKADIKDRKTCGNICGKSKNCGVHKCEKKCHWGKCGICEKTKSIRCFCINEKREISCGDDKENIFSCGRICGKK